MSVACLLKLVLDENSSENTGMKLFMLEIFCIRDSNSGYLHQREIEKKNNDFTTEEISKCDTEDQN